VSPRCPRETLLRQFDTSRVIPSRFAALGDSVLVGIADDDAMLFDIFALDGATSERLRGEQGDLPGIGRDELVFGVPNFRIINAAFTYARPEGSRFNGPDRGAWYCSFELETALAEVAFHKSVEYQEIGRFDDSVTYAALLADFTNQFHDLRGDRRFAPCLNPRSYVESQRLGEALLDAGSVGVIFPSVRRPDGINLACFRPAVVGNVRQGDTWRFTWSGDPAPRIEKEKTAPKIRPKRAKVVRVPRFPG
jgi:RES domain-containing protein